MRIVLIIVFFTIHFMAQGQKRDSSAAQQKTENPQLRVTTEATNWDEYLIITITGDSVKARYQNKPVVVSNIIQLDEYLQKNIQTINKEKIAVEYPLSTSFQTVEPLFSLLKKHKIYRWRLVALQ